MTMSVPFETFSKLDLRVGKIVSVEDMPSARKPMYKFRIDFGPLGVKQCVGGIKQFYKIDQLNGKLVVAVMNLEPKPIAGVLSECMMLAAYEEDLSHLSLVTPDKEMVPGTKVA